MRDLEHALHELADDMVWPATPDLAAGVAARLAAAGPAGGARKVPRRRWRRRRRLVVALLAALVALPTAAFALPGPRNAILETLGLRHVSVERRPNVPAGGSARLGIRTTLAAAPRLAGFAPQAPAALGRPDRVFVNQGIVTLEYEPEHLLLAQARGRLERAILRKIVGVDTSVLQVRVNGRPGIYLPAPHDYAWTDATGPPVRSGPALVWEQDGLVLRLEGAGSPAAARRIAESVG
ncbi:MAG: hypothetical protein QOH46_391 [Solirubrobacteraceae bacterium]|nr:hypothetical protein [Solirubrobacteraceae bacterium]